MMQPLIVEKKTDPLGETLQNHFLDFLENRSKDYEVVDGDEMIIDEETIFLYRQKAEAMKHQEKRTMEIDIRHIFEWDKTYEIREMILTEFSRYEIFLNRAVEEFMKKLYFDWAKGKNFCISFINSPQFEKIRGLRTSEIGKLINICGTITRSSEVKPELIIGAFNCKMCNSLVKGVEQQFRYTEPKICTNPNCNNRFKWELQKEECTFADWQKLRVQENPSDIPAGSMPRSIDVILRNELVETCKPGDKCNFIGCLLVVPDVFSLYKPGEKVQHHLKRESSRKEEQKSLDGVTGLKNLGMRDMTYKLIFIAQSVQQAQKSFNSEIVEDLAEQFTQRELDLLVQMKSEQNIYSKLSKSIAPSVYGHDEVKRGILLMLLGGVNKTTNEGIKLRGDINICIVGDPSTSKSQFLKYVCQLVPRAVYTSGKGSSAAGLTASVQRDSETGEFCIEAGALMLADNGICCIDEFDKMDPKDQVAIHEAMEQQTISIAKAGIQATLMSRTSILAAANPLYGRYDKTKTLKNNIDITAPIMSRFDLFFVIVDECNEFVDYSIAQHIINLHRVESFSTAQNSINEDVIRESFKTPFNQEELALYIRAAKSIRPKFTKEAAVVLRDEYKELRQADVSYQKSSYRITVRQLESLIRLSEGLARAHLDNLIHPAYVQEASRLLKQSIITVEMPDVEMEGEFERNLEKQRKNYQDKEKGENVIMLDETSKDQKRRIVLSGIEYEKYKSAIIHFVRELERQEIKTKHKDIIEYYLEQFMDKLESTAEAAELSEKLNAVIEKLINKEGILIVDNDNVNKEERVLSLNINYDAPMFG